MSTWKPSSSAAATTRRRVSGRSWPRPFNALDTVPIDTPANAATSLTVARRSRSTLASFPGKFSARIVDEMGIDQGSTRALWSGKAQLYRGKLSESMARPQGRGAAMFPRLAVLAVALALTACGSGATSSSNPDDGSQLTMWVRSATDQFSQRLVDAYNAGHKNKVALTIIPND